MTPEARYCEDTIEPLVSIETKRGCSMDLLDRSIDWAGKWSNPKEICINGISCL